MSAQAIHFIHFVYGNHDLGAQAVAVVQHGNLGRIYKSAPTVFINYMAHSGSICAMTILFQQSHVRVICINLMTRSGLLSAEPKRPPCQIESATQF